MAENLVLVDLVVSQSPRVIVESGHVLDDLLFFALFCLVQLFPVVGRLLVFKIVNVVGGVVFLWLLLILVVVIVLVIIVRLLFVENLGFAWCNDGVRRGMLGNLLGPGDLVSRVSSLEIIVLERGGEV